MTCWAPFFMEKNDKIFHSKAGKKAHAGVWRTEACRPGPDMM
ncbi:hypothetical protein DESPIG_00933 [Desulfovibrio piger ATCC 29098]|uniref:Uncharacterized protein n=1 Tax=Desulfovibrio piger ATCC 29098 TaxID=411464 RepID=B6WS87_9BACT|nr:hypothetical protein DESPIG_00933 [Desulfovibrio piger ATCC 29098]